MVLDNFLALSRQSGAVYPADDSAYTSPSLKVIKRMVDKMADGIDNSLTLQNTRRISVESVSDTHNNTQFTGDGTPAHPDLFDRDVLTILPFQVNANKFVIFFYVMTRDYSKNLTPEQFNVKLSGINGATSLKSVYDPVNDTPVPFSQNSGGFNILDLTLTATDYPYLLIVDESINPDPSQSASASPSGIIKPGDIDGNNKVDIFDYNILLTNFGRTGSNLNEDLDKNGKVDIFDYNLLLSNFGN